MARRFTRSVVPRARRSVVWSGQDTVGTLVFGAVTRTAAGVSIFPIGAEALEKFTITRIIADLLLTFRASDTAGSLAVCYTGIIIVSVEAFGIGATAVPDPRTRQSDDWLYLGMHTLMSVATGISGSGVQERRMALDLKGQRKTGPGEVVCGVFALDGLTGSTRTIQAALQFRNLLKLT